MKPISNRIIEPDQADPEIKDLKMVESDSEEPDYIGTDHSEPSPTINNIIMNEIRLGDNTTSNLSKTNPLWKVLVQTVESDVLYTTRLAYVRQEIFPNNPDISPESISERLGYPLGVSMVILHNLKSEKISQKRDNK